MIGSSIEPFLTPEKSLGKCERMIDLVFSIEEAISVYGWHWHCLPDQYYV
jgi:hypothetical protein